MGSPEVEADRGALGNDRDLESEALSLSPGSPLFTVHSWADCLTSLGSSPLILEGDILKATKWVIGI